MNRVTNHLGTKYPIIQAPMGWIARSQLASAVSNAGGLGVIETSSGEVEACKKEIQKMSTLTSNPFGVNLPILFYKMTQLLILWLNAELNLLLLQLEVPPNTLTA